MLCLLYRVQTQLKLPAEYPACFTPVITSPALCRDLVSCLQACEPFHGKLSPDVQPQRSLWAVSVSDGN